jgi:hypothetical protein
MVTIGFEVELDPFYVPGQPITFYCDLDGRRELGRIPPTAHEYSRAERVISEYRAVKHPPGTLAGTAVPCRMALEEQRARGLISDGHTWGKFTRRRPGEGWQG